MYGGRGGKVDSCFQGLISVGYTHIYTHVHMNIAIPQAAEPLLLLSPHLCSGYSPLCLLHIAKQDKERQLLFNILHIKNSIKPVPLVGQGLCDEAN